MMEIKEFISSVEKFNIDLNTDSNSRYCSWEHCYRHFYLARKQQNPDYN